MRHLIAPADCACISFVIAGAFRVIQHVRAEISISRGESRFNVMSLFLRGKTAPFMGRCRRIAFTQRDDNLALKEN